MIKLKKLNNFSTITPKDKKRIKQKKNTLKTNKKKIIINSRLFPKLKKITLKPLYYYYKIKPGNNPELIKKVISIRKLWKEKEIWDDSHFIWQPLSQNIKWEKYNKFINNNIYSVNHHEYSYEIGKKDKLPRNIKNYLISKKYELFKVVPPTFEIYLDQDNKHELELFFEIFNKFNNYKGKKGYKEIDLFNEFEKFRGKCSIEILFYGGFQKVNKVFYKDQNIWLIKPTNLNRGNGINIFNNLNDFNKLIEEYKNNEYLNHRNRLKLVIQKYCERPLLINERKFDIRIWGLLTHRMEFFIAKEGYIRTSSFKHKNFNGFNNKSIFLTNNAIQIKDKENFGWYEEGNIMSYWDFKNYLTNNTYLDFDKIHNKLKIYSKITILSSLNKINKNLRKYCFELYGFDYLIDKKGDAWLIEVNTNPSLTESSSWLKLLFPRWIDDAFKLTIDKIFNTFNNKNKKSKFPINSMDDYENSWELVIKNN